MTSVPTVDQARAFSTAAPASIAPKPYFSETSCPAPLTTQDESVASFLRAELTRMC